MINFITCILHIIIGIALGTAGVGINTWQMWVIWLCIMGISICRAID